MDNEAGGHRIQRVPPTEKRGRVHTSTVTVAVINGATKEPRLELDEGDLKIEWYSGSGAGGQHRNKHQNSCRLTHVPTGTMRKAETRRRKSSYREALAALTTALTDDVMARQHLRENRTRKAQVGSGMRGDKRRTYRFQDDVVVDHSTGRKARCSDVMRGMADLLW